MYTRYWWKGGEGCTWVPNSVIIICITLAFKGPNEIKFPSSCSFYKHSKKYFLPWNALSLNGRDPPEFDKDSCPQRKKYKIFYYNLLLNAMSMLNAIQSEKEDRPHNPESRSSSMSDGIFQHLGWCHFSLYSMKSVFTDTSENME